MNIAFELRKAAIGVEEWRVADPETGCYCIAFSHGNSLNPQRAAVGWLEDHRERFPGSQHAHYEVKRVMAQDQTDELMNAAADEIDRLRSLLDGAKPVEFLLDGTRLKLSFQQVTCDECGHETDELRCEPLSQYVADLQGQWVALVPAENDRHLKMQTAAPNYK